ncbi:MAG TPA: ankyrin repeat domain-containing protein [Terriglobales bacterium]|nr:ankyrin repeat domain-containing protein [Terriglobales bacterium]
MAVFELHRAVREGNLFHVVDILKKLGQNADINGPDRKGWTPLMYAVGCPEVDSQIVRALIGHGASVDESSTALALSDLEKLKVLIEAGADVLHHEEHGYDALINAACGRDAAHNTQLLDILDLLIAKGVSLRGMTTYGESAVRVLSRMGRFDAVQFLLKKGANPQDIKFTPLIEAVAWGALDEVAALVKAGANLEEREYWERTPWLIAIQTGQIERAEFLLKAGVDRNARGGRGDTPPLFYAIDNGGLPMLRWLLSIGINLEQTDDFGKTALFEAVEQRSYEAVDILLAAGADVRHQCKTGPPLSFATNGEIAVRLMEAGDDPLELGFSARRSIIGYPPEPDADLLNATAAEFTLYRDRRFGQNNAEVMNNPFWIGMIRSGINSYAAKSLFELEEASDSSQPPVWCAQRFGQSLTFLTDGRIVQVAGEHEDSYDPDFCIYNDVFVHCPDGTVVIYGYPEALFPPTDFHTATLVGNHIYLIGCLGYQHARLYGETPVYRLDIRTFQIERVQTTGDKPGWIYKHRATLASPGRIQVAGGEILSKSNDELAHSKNARVFTLDIEHLVWFSESDGDTTTGRPRAPAR